MPRTFRCTLVAAALVLAGCAGRNSSGVAPGTPGEKSVVSSARPPAARGVQKSAASAEPDVHTGRPAAGPGTMTGPAVYDTNGALVGYRVETPPPDPRHDVSLDQIRECVQYGAGVLMDVRSPENFARGHLSGALNLPAGSAEEMATCLEQIRPDIDPQELIILYCSGPGCGSAEMVCEFLAEHGYTNTRVYRPGWKALAAAKDLQ